MKMKHSVIAALLALGMGTACVESTPTLQLGGASPQGADCSIGGSDVGILRGSLNLALRSGGYTAVFAVTSNLAETVLAVSDEPVSGDADLNTLYITGLLPRYEIPGYTIPAQTEGGEPVVVDPVDLSGVNSDNPVRIYSALSEDGDLLLNLFTPALNDVLNRVIGPGASREVLVHFKLVGQRASGDEVESNEITFPVIVSNRPFSCPAGQQPVQPTDACPQIGLNGVVPTCEPIPTR